MLPQKIYYKLLFIGFLGLGNLFLFACGEDQKIVVNESTPELPVTELITIDTTIQQEYVSTINAVKNVEIRARVGGFLERIYVDEGQEVRKGQALFRLNSEEYEAALAKAKANLKNAIANAKAAQLEVDRIQLLVEKNVISGSELEVAKAKLSASKARIEEAKSAKSNAAIHLSYTFLRSPFDGTIDRIPLKVGSLIDEGTLLTRVSDNSSIYAYFNVSESEYLNFEKLRASGASSSNLVELKRADGTMHPYQGKIETMEGQFDASTGTIAFRAKFPNPEGVLKHGSSGKVLLTKSVEEALIIPQKAAFEIQDKNYVFLLNPENNTVIQKSFVPQMRFSNFYMVKSGLSKGDKIVYEGIQELRDGVQIKPIEHSLDSLIQASTKGRVFL